MATKQVMISEMLQTYETFKGVFNELKITEVIFLKWMSALRDYDAVRSGNKFLHGKFYKSLVIIRQILSNHSADVWVRLKYYSKNERLVKILSDTRTDSLLIWKKRPKFRKRGSQ